MAKTASNYEHLWVIMADKSYTPPGVWTERRHKYFHPETTRRLTAGQRIKLGLFIGFARFLHKMNLVS